MSNRILFLEDEALFAETLVDLLEESGYEITHCSNGEDVIDATFSERFDLYLLDINVPRLNGLDLLKELRNAQDSTPAIFLTSHKDKEMLKKGFICGGDDYITKPFDTEELLLRIEALLKRYTATIPQQVGFLSHDSVHKRVLYKDQELELSKKEYQLLTLLLLHVNAPVPKELIIETLWSSSESGSDGAIRVYINRIKQLVPEIVIENIRGIGYKLVSQS